MDNDRAEGSMKTIKGRVKEGLGKALGDTKLETEGKMDKAEGKVQNAIGGMKDHCASTPEFHKNSMRRPGLSRAFFIDRLCGSRS